MATAEKQTQFSWGNAALYGLAAFGVVLVGSVALSLGADLSRAELGAAGERTGRLAAPAVLLAIATSYLRQTGRTRWAWTAAGVTVLAIAAALVVPVLERGRSTPVPLTAGERADLRRSEVEGAIQLEHPTLGFSFTVPDASLAAMQLPPEAAQADESVAMWGYQTTGDPPVLILVTLQRGDRVTESALREFTSGFRDGFLDQFRGAGMQIDVKQDHVVWEPSFKGSHFHATAGDEVHIRLESWLLPTESHIVGMALMSADDAVLTGVVASFRL